MNTEMQEPQRQIIMQEGWNVHQTKHHVPYSERVSVPRRARRRFLGRAYACRQRSLNSIEKVNGKLKRNRAC